MTTYTARSLANAVIRAASSTGVDADGAVVPPRPVTGPEVGHLVYVAHGISLALYDRPILADPAVATRRGVMIPALHAALGRERAEPLRSFDPETGRFAEDPPPPASDVVANGALRAVWDRHSLAGAGSAAVDAQGPGSPWVHLVSDPDFQPGTPIPDAMTELYFAGLAADEIAGTY
ncbi:hypothetical protein RQM47_16360 [Rubrivirga sp. S365]|uniref:hypothetical protein n=1 Tax=Rubrivirga sp. S365 TaxID=3076080 RepID=UPI0028CAC03C|nr:hypothetical protein [Rubrivirga sp. S365]MDT7858223.1 hypothetical protein [Rubrivirga sp. S365]